MFKTLYSYQKTMNKIRKYHLNVNKSLIQTRKIKAELYEEKVYSGQGTVLLSLKL